jgi:hypothetical protein
MVDRYAKFATENLEVAASRIEKAREKNGRNSIRFPSVRGDATAANDEQVADS